MDNSDHIAKARVLIVTGFSGAGMSTTLKNLEDMGYEVFDNFPLTLVPALCADRKDDPRPMAIGIDSRTRGFNTESAIAMAKDNDAGLLFIAADESELITRFNETRRRHPLAVDRPPSAGVRKERELLAPLRAAADLVIDTTGLSSNDLRRVIAGHFEDKNAGHLTITLMSFGFRNGLPRDADVVMDVRFLANPHWVADLRPLTGRDQPVGDYVSGDPAFAAFITDYKTMIGRLLPRYAGAGKSYLTLAIGCTGGRHRSVYTVESLRGWITAQGFAVNILHRDLDD